MSKCCKCDKYWPHNWLCLKGLYVIFLVLFYLMLVYTIFQDILVIKHPMITGRAMWGNLAYYTLSDLAAAIGFLTIAKILNALRKIKHAVAPCCCEAAKQKETK